MANLSRAHCPNNIIMELIDEVYIEKNKSVTFYSPVSLLDFMKKVFDFPNIPRIALETK
jgi:hypothetical protein